MSNSLLKVLLQECKGNSICVIERFKIMIDHGYEASSDDIKLATELLGSTSKKIDVFRDKYIQVFLRNIDKFCYEEKSAELCVYSWRTNTPIRYFPVSLDSTGTILLFSGDRVEVLAYPTTRALDIGGHGVKIPDPSQNPVVEVSKRVDGYQITFYYNTLLKKWVPAAKHALHNMKLRKGRLYTANIEEFIDPYSSIAHEIALEVGLYDKFKGFEGWTFTAILEPPEPAIIKSNVELFDKSSFKLYMLNARKHDGTLLTIRETYDMLKYRSVEVENLIIPDSAALNKLIEVWRNDLIIRSRFVRFKLGDLYRPYTLEVASKLYPEAVNIKFYSNPKSLIMIASSGHEREAVELITDYGDLRTIGKEIVEIYRELVKLISSYLNSVEIDHLIKELRLGSSVEGELVKARRHGSVDRFVKKLLLSVITDDIKESKVKAKELLDKLKERINT